MSTTPRLTLDHVWIAAALILLALRPLLTPIPPHDFWWHLATGRLTLEQGAIPTTDTFSYTRTGTPFYNQGWLAQVAMFLVYQAGGIPLTLIVQALVIAGAYGGLLWLCVRLTGRVRLSIALLLLTTLPLSFDNWNVRPQSYVFPLFVASLIILTLHRRGDAAPLWLLPPIMIIWVNLHGTFVLLPVLLVLTLFGMLIDIVRAPAAQRRERLRSLVIGRSALILWSVAVGIAMLINPRGIEILSYVRNLVGSSAVTNLVTEWAPPTVRDINGTIFYLFVIGFFLALAYGRTRPDPGSLLMALAFLWLALGATRSIVWFGFVATPLLCVQLAALLPPPRRTFAGQSLINGILIGLLLVMLAIGSPWLKPLLLPPSVGALLSPETPVAAVAALRREPERPQRLFHAMSYGSYLIWAAPEQRVFIDPRIELYPYSQWQEYIAFGQALNLNDMQRTYQFDALLLDRKEQQSLVEAIRRDSTWQLRYEDSQTVLFVRAS